MTPKPSEFAIRCYLLHLMPGRLRQRWHRQLISDGLLFERLSAGEDELILDYLDGRLSLWNHRLFDHAYLRTASGREAVDVVRRRQRAAAVAIGAITPARSGPVRRWTMVTAGAAAIVAVIAALNISTRAPMNVSSIEYDLAPPPDRGPAAHDNVAPLVPGRDVRLRFSGSLAASCADAEAALRPLDSKEQPKLLPAAVERGAFVVNVPTGVLTPGDYILEIHEGGPAGEVCASRFFRATAPSPVNLDRSGSRERRK